MTSARRRASRVYTSAITAWLQKVPESPKASAPAVAATARPLSRTPVR
jgi:hypothetical protein